VNLLFDIGHPGQVHLFRNAIAILESGGHNVTVTVKDLPSARQLLDAYGIKWLPTGRKFDSLLLKGLSQAGYNYRLWQIARERNIDIAIGSSITVAHVSFIHRMRSIILDDDDAEAVRLFSLFAHPFAGTVLSPAALAHQRTHRRDIVYRGTHELFYLHPRYFSPDPSVPEKAGIDISQPFFVLRFVSGKAYHDKGEHWITLDQKLQTVRLLEHYGRVYITTERAIEPELAPWQLKVSPELIHHLLWYATMFIGDSQTMTSEAAILGTPALKCNSFAHKLSVPNMLEDKYDLCYAFQPAEFDKMLKKTGELLATAGLKELWQDKRARFLADTIDPTAYLVWFIENYPASRRHGPGDILKTL
jgi:predicted glycosyltransferase